MGFAFDQRRRFVSPQIKLMLPFARKPNLHAMPLSESDPLLAEIFLGGILKVAAHMGIRY